MEPNKIQKEKQKKVQLQKEKDANIKFSLNSFKATKCSYYLLGEVEFEQKEYNCSACDPNRSEKICQDCFENCHKNCKKDLESENFGKLSEFVCECGREDKHYIAPVRSVSELTPCVFKMLDKRIGNFKKYRCKLDNVILCSICYYECHEMCQDSKKEKVEISESEMEGLECQCQHDNHSAMNEFTFDINPGDYADDLKFIWPIQMLNVLMDSDNTYDSLVNYTQKYLNENKTEVRFSNIVALLTATFHSTFKTYYYHPNINNMFPYESFVVFLQKSKPEKPQEFILKMRLIFVLLFVHVKKDFQLIKSFTTSDFMTSTILERLLHREFLMSSNVYTKDLHEKYQIHKEDTKVDPNSEGNAKLKASDISLKRVTMNIGNLLVESSKNNVSLLDYTKEYSICLKFISFMLKRMVFSVRGLNKLIKSLFEFNEVFISTITDELGNGLPKDIETLFPIFSYLAKIYYLIGINYNDLITAEHLKNGTYKIRYANFVHTFNDSVGKLFKMIAKNCTVMSHHYDNIIKEKDIKLRPKVVKIFNEALKLFCMADNSYFHQLQKITPTDLKVYTFRLNELGKQTKANQAFKSVSRETYRESLMSMESEVDLLLEFKQKVEAIMEDFFTYKNITDVNERLIKHMKDFSIKSMNSLYNQSKTEHMNDPAKDGKLIEMSEFDEDQKQTINDYTIKVIASIKNHLPFVMKDNFVEYIDIYIEELIYSAIDETISKFLFFFCQQVTDEENKLVDFEIDFVLSFLSLFCLNKTGIKYFLSGKNVRRIMSIFSAFPGKILKLFYFICKGLDLYRVDISNHQILKNLQSELIHYIQNKAKNLKKEQDEIDFKTHLTIIMKIFYSICEYYEYEEYDQIKRDIANVMRTCPLNLLHSESFMNIFDLDCEKDRQMMKDRSANKERESNSVTPAEIIIHGEKASKISNEEDEKHELLLVNDNVIKPGKKIFQRSKQAGGSQVSLLGEEQLLNRTIEAKSDFNLNNSLNIGSALEYSRSIKTQNFRANTLWGSVNDLILFEDIYKDSSKLMHKLYFSFFTLMDKNTFYTFDDPEELVILKDIYNFMDIELFKILLSKKALTIRRRRILLGFIRTYFFIDILNRKSIDDKKKYLTTEEYVELLKSGNKKIGKLMYPVSDDPQTKYEFLLQFQQVILLFVEEIKNLDKILANEREIINVQKYLKKLILSVKSVADFFFLEKDIWNNMTVYFYEIAKEFIIRADTIKEIMISVINEKRIGKFNNIPISKVNAAKIEQMEDAHFDIFNKQLIYDLLLETFSDIFKATKMDAEFDLTSFLDYYDNIAELNFTPFELFETKDYEYFYEKAAEEEVTDPDEIVLKSLRDSFNDQFIEIKFSTFLSIVGGISGETELVDFRVLIVEYFIKYIQSDYRYHTHNFTYALICIVTKLLFYDTDQTQEKMVFLTKDVKYNDFFHKFNSKLQETFVLNFSNCKNFFNVRRYVEITNENKLIIQFLQLLSEGFNQSFHPKIFGVEEEINETREANAEEKEIVDSNFFNNNVNNLIASYKLMNLEYFAEGELPYDNLIVLFTNIVDFLIEYIGACEDEQLNKVIHQNIEMLFKVKMHRILFLNIKSPDKTKFTMRKKLLIYLKIIFMNLLITYISVKRTKEQIKMISRKYSPPALFEQLIINFHELLITMQEKTGEDFKSLPPDQFKRRLVKLYIHEVDFRESLELTLCFRIFTFIKILSDIYGIKSLKKHFEENENEAMNDMETKPNNSAHDTKSDDLGFYSKFAYKTYLLFEKLVCKVEINNNGVNSYTFFVRPALTFHLTDQTKNSFLENVNRESQFNKLNYLVEETDYFIFEMAGNSHQKRTDFLNTFVQNVDFRDLEWINYIFFIVLQQALLIYDFYKSPILADDVYTKIDDEDLTGIKIDNLIVGLIQIGYLAIILILWYIYKFPLYYQHNIMQILRKSFIFQTDSNVYETTKKKVKGFFEEPEMKPLQIIRELNSDVSGFTKFKIGLVDSILFNNEVNILVFSLIFAVLYVTIGSPVIMAIPSLFIANLSPVLFDIFVATKMRYKQLLLVLMFTFIFIYLFVWISMLWVNELYFFDGVIAPKVEGSEPSNESFCTSSLQCIFFMIDNGLRGNIPNMLANVSYKQTSGYFYGKFFYSVIFYIVVIMILGNIFLGIIVDTFADLRDRNQKKEDDMKLVCYICGITRDQCLKKKIDFELHRNEDHKTWNYVYFLTYLHISDSNDFNGLENVVWEMLGKKDISWIPVVDDAEGKPEEEEED